MKSENLDYLLDLKERSDRLKTWPKPKFYPGDPVIVTNGAGEEDSHWDVVADINGWYDEWEYMLVLGADNAPESDLEPFDLDAAIAQAKEG